MSAHSATCGLVGKHAITVVLNIGNIVEGTEQRAGIQNCHHAIRTVAAAVLHDACFYGSDAAVVLYTSLQIDDGAGASAMGPENFFARVGDLDRTLSFASSHSRDDLKRNHFAFSTKPTAD